MQAFESDRPRELPKGLDIGARKAFIESFEATKSS